MDKYTKIVYQSPPIGEYGIRLVLTTFDKDAFDRDMELERLEREERERNMLYNTYRSVDNYIETTCWGDTARSIVKTLPPRPIYHLNDDDPLYKLEELRYRNYLLNSYIDEIRAKIEYFNRKNDWRDLDD